MRTASDRSQSFDEIFDLRSHGGDRHKLRFAFAWGGSTLAAAVRAACLSAPEKELRALHAWFLRPVESNVAVDVAVERVRDGRLLSHRRVTFEADGKRLFEMSATLAAAEAGGAIAWQESPLAPGVAQPLDLPSLEDLRPSPEGGRDPIDWRVVGAPLPTGEGDQPSSWAAWVRPSAPLPDGPGWDAAALAYLSDNHSDWSLGRKVRDYTIRRYASLDTMIWFHRPPRWRDWAYITSVCEVAHDGFGLGRRNLYDRSGALMATMGQEALYR